MKKKIFEFYYINFLTDKNPLDGLSVFYTSNKPYQIFDYLINNQIQKKEEKIIGTYSNFIKSKNRKLSILNER